MMKKIAILCLISFIFFSTAASSAPAFLLWFVPKKHGNCQQSLPANNKGFCASFKSIARCYCMSSWLPDGMCKDTNAIYNRMIGVFGSVQKACQFQKDTPEQNCMDDWKCYRLGGKDSHNKLCSGTGTACG